jgi:tetratricopeptide (TPR) repeat protein
MALARAGEYWEAIDDFSQALDRSLDSPDALVFRAAAYRLLGVADLADDNIARALTLDPNNPEALTELGMMRKNMGTTTAPGKPGSPPLPPRRDRSPLMPRAPKSNA